MVNYIGRLTSILFIVSVMYAGAGYVSFYLENDLLVPSSLHEDRWYTNGARITCGIGKNRALFIAQNMYTPSEIGNHISAPPSDDRPYAGWLHVGYSQWVTSPLGLKLGNFYGEVSAGTLGKASLSEGVQKWVHRHVDATTPLGWDTQLANELAIQTYGKYEIDVMVKPWLLAGMHAGGSLGTVKVVPEIGLTVKAGAGLRSPLPFEGITVKDNVPARFIFIRIVEQYTLHDAFLPSTYSDGSAGPGHVRLVTDVVAGVVWGFRSGIDITYQFTYRTAQFKAQDEPAVFGAIGFRYNY